MSITSVCDVADELAKKKKQKQKQKQTKKNHKCW